MQALEPMSEAGRQAYLEGLARDYLSLHRLLGLTIEGLTLIKFSTRRPSG